MIIIVYGGKKMLKVHVLDTSAYLQNVEVQSVRCRVTDPASET